MSEFKKSFMGYDPSQVEQQLEQIKQAQKKVWEDMTGQLDELENENSQLKQEVEKLREENNLVAKTMIDAQKAAENIKQSALLENQRIRDNAKALVGKLMEFSKLSSALISASELEQLRDDLNVSANIEDIKIPGGDDLNLSGILKAEPEEIVSSQLVEIEEDDVVSIEYTETSSQQAQDFKEAIEDKKLSDSIDECETGSIADAVMGYIRK